MNVRLHLRISGHVQGVSYRASARDEARARGLVGWVRNLPGGDVEALVEGPGPAVDAFVSWCRRGPAEARVTHVAATPGAPGGELGPFEVVR